MNAATLPRRPGFETSLKAADPAVLAWPRSGPAHVVTRPQQFKDETPHVRAECGRWHRRGRRGEV
jgi:hypothetical protein